jgi:hypothetical protein
MLQTPDRTIILLLQTWITIQFRISFRYLQGPDPFFPAAAVSSGYGQNKVNFEDCMDVNANGFGGIEYFQHGRILRSNGL